MSCPVPKFYLSCFGRYRTPWAHSPNSGTTSSPVLRRRRTLHDPILLALSDPDLTVLDLWGCGTMISDRGVRKAICNMPNLLVLNRGGDLESESL